MEPELLQKKVEWLESERRESAETISRLEERIEALEKALSNQARQHDEVTEELSLLNARAQKINQIDEALTAHRKEVSRQLDQAEKRRSEKEKGLEAIRKADQTATNRQIEELRGALQEIDNLRKELHDVRSGEAKANSERDALSKRLEAATNAAVDGSTQLTLHVDELRKLSRDLGEADAEIANLKKLNSQTEGKVEAIEDRTRRTEVRLSELAASEDERQSAQEVWLEKQNLQMVEYQHSWAEWERRFGDIEKVADELNERVAAFQSTYSKLKQMQSDLEEVILRLERRINEITEMQRLAENRQEQAWTTFQAENQKRWSTFKLTEDERWREHDRLHEKIETRLSEDENLSATLEEQLTTKVQLDRTSIQEIQDTIHQWLDSLSEDFDLEP